MLELVSIGVFAIFTIFKNDLICYKSYIYNDLDASFRSEIETTSRITQIEKYSSPVGDANQFLFQHHEIVVEMDGILWGLISFGIDGLETRVVIDKDELIARRPNNKLIESKKVNVPAKLLRDFLKKNEGKCFNYLSWDSQHYSMDFWGTMVLHQLVTTFVQKLAPPPNQDTGEATNNQTRETASASFFPTSASADFASASVSNSFDSSVGNSYSYNETHSTFLQKIQAAKRITHIEKYSSPVGGANQSLFEHHEILFQIDNLLWGLVSLGNDGLETGIAMGKEGFIVRRPNNKLIESKKVNVPAKQFRDFLKKNEGYRYNLLLWNCQHFSNALLGVIDESFTYSATDPDFLDKIQAASRITRIEMYGIPFDETSFYRREIIFEIDGLLWGLISFRIDGLEARVGMKKDTLIASRPSNKLIASKKIDVSTEKLQHFFSQYEGRRYRLFTWNGQHFSQALWDAIVQ